VILGTALTGSTNDESEIKARVMPVPFLDGYEKRGLRRQN